MPRNNPPAPLVTTPLIRLVPQITDPNVVITETVFDYLCQSAITLSPSVLASFIADWQAATLVALEGVLSDLLNVGTITCADLNPGSVPTQQVTGLTAPGSVSAPPLPSVVAGIISKTSALKGQHGRGRNYLPGVPDTFVTSATEANQLNALGITAYNALAAKLKAPITSSGVVWSPVITTRPLPPTLIPQRAVVITGAVTIPLLGTVRRRREGRGI